MRLLINVLWTVLFYVFSILTFLILYPILFFIALLPESLRYENRLYFFVSRIIGWAMLKFSGASLTISGVEHLPSFPNSPSVIIANHTSALDIALIEMLMGSYPHVWLSKDEYRSVPLFGFLLKRMHILVKRHDASQSRRALVKAVDLMDGKKSHLLIFPEGTRGLGDTLLPFHAGFAVIAHKLNRPIIPVVIHGFSKLFPKKKWLIDSSYKEVRIIIGEPLHIRDGQPTSSFVEETHDAMAEMLSNLCKGQQ